MTEWAYASAWVCACEPAGDDSWSPVRPADVAACPRCGEARPPRPAATASAALPSDPTLTDAERGALGAYLRRK